MAKECTMLVAMEHLEVLDFRAAYVPKFPTMPYNHIKKTAHFLPDSSL